MELSRNAHHAIGGGFHALSHPKDYLLDSPFIDLLQSQPSVAGHYYRGMLPCFFAGITFSSLFARKLRLATILARVSEGSMISEM